MPRPARWLLLSILPIRAAMAGEPCADEERVPYAERSFLGYACPDDCAAQKAGFGWAVQHRIADPAACGTLEPAQAQGCRALLEEGLVPEEAGFAWALENEIERACLCDGAGEGFRAGCLRHVVAPSPVQRPPGGPAEPRPVHDFGPPGRVS